MFQETSVRSLRTINVLKFLSTMSVQSINANPIISFLKHEISIHAFVIISVFKYKVSGAHSGEDSYFTLG